MTLDHSLIPLSAEELQRLRALAPELAGVVQLDAFVLVPYPADHPVDGYAVTAAAARLVLRLAVEEPLVGRPGARHSREYVRFIDLCPMIGDSNGDRRRLRRAARTAGLYGSFEYLDAPVRGSWALTPTALLDEQWHRRHNQEVQ